MATDTHTIPLSGSADLIAEFFSYGLNSILYQRGLYPPETFKRLSKYGLTMLVTTDPAVQEYLNSVLSQMRTWLLKSQLRRVAVIIASVAQKSVLERWVFDVHLEDASVRAQIENGITPQAAPPPGSKHEQRIVSEIQALVRQITASVAFLPLLDEACAFDVLIYTTEDAPTPIKWEPSLPQTIPNAQKVQLRSFSTSVHNVDTSVSYAAPDSSS